MGNAISSMLVCIWLRALEAHFAQMMQMGTMWCMIGGVRVFECS